MSSFFFHNIGELKTKIYLKEYQRLTLAKSFHSNPYPKKNELDQLARSLNLSNVWIAKWHERERRKKKQTGLIHTGEGC